MKWLLFLAAFAAAPVLFAGCEGDTVGEPSPTSDFPLCEGNKSDDPSCPVALQGEDAVSSTDTTEGSQPDTEQPAPPPDCSKVTDPYSVGTWLDCGPVGGQCQIEWHYDEEWGCFASCPPEFEFRRPEDFSNPAIFSCSPANL